MKTQDSLCKHAGLSVFLACIHQVWTGFIQASMSKIQGLLEDPPTVFKDYKLMKNTDLNVEILLQKC